MMKKQIIVVGLLIISIVLLSGCFDDPEGKLKIYTGDLIEVVDRPFGDFVLIFKNDKVLELSSNQNYSYFQEYVGQCVKIRYYERIGMDFLIDMKPCD